MYACDLLFFCLYNNVSNKEKYYTILYNKENDVKNVKI